MTMALAPSSPDMKALPGMAMGATAFALMTSVDTIFKLMSGGHPAYQILFINACFSLVPIIGWALMTGGLVRFRTPRLAWHLTRGMAGFLSAVAAIYAYGRLPLTDFYAIVFTGPLLVSLLSTIWLKEKIETLSWMVIALGFAGALIVANPFETHPDLVSAEIPAGRIAAFISVFLYALSVIIIRRIRLGESNLAFSFYGYFCAIIIGGLLLGLRGAPVMHGRDIAQLALSGLMAGTATICLMTAYQRTQVALVAPFQYTQIVWGALASYVIWAQIPGPRLILGAIVVASCGLFVIYREITGGTTGTASQKF